MDQVIHGALPLPDATGKPRIYASADLEPLVRVNESLWQFLTRVNPEGTVQDKTIMQEADDPTKMLSYGGARIQAAQLAAGLVGVLGLEPGDTIVVVGPNTLAYALLAYSCTWAGIVVAAVNAMASAHEMVHYLGISEAKVVFMDKAIEETVRKGIQMSTYSAGVSPPRIVALGEKTITTSLSFPASFLSKTGAKIRPFNLSRGDNRKIPAFICFSSGTSGKPKAVLLSHHNLIAHLVGSRSTSPSAFRNTEIEVFYAPFAHIYGLITALLSPIFNGLLVIVIKKFEYNEYIKFCAKHRATIIRIVPPTANALSKDPIAASYDLTSVHTLSCAGAALGIEVIGRLQKMMPKVSVVQGYGMTEGAITSLRNSFAITKLGSVGTVMTNAQVRLVDDELNDVEPGTLGEILVRGPTVFMGYKNNPTANAEAFPFRDEWMRTGDVARIDEDGFFWLTDRKKDLIKYKGNQVPPAELEDVVLAHPAVQEAAVCAVWNAEQETEMPLAYVSLQPAVKESERSKVLLDIRNFVDGRVAPYKKLRGGVHYLADLPRNPTGKLLRRLLPARMEEEARKKALARRAAKL